jgi:hypothetical protein
MLRNEMVVVRCSTPEKRALEGIARIECRNLSEALRELIRRAAEKRGLWPPKEQADD